MTTRNPNNYDHLIPPAGSPEFRDIVIKAISKLIKYNEELDARLDLLAENQRELVEVIIRLSEAVPEAKVRVQRVSPDILETILCRKSSKPDGSTE